VVFGVVVLVLGPRVRSSAQIVQPMPTARVADPYARASALQQTYFDSGVRKAARLVREELVDNQTILHVMRNEGRDLDRKFSREGWKAHQEALLEHRDRSRSA
jgi:hypothetical protein